MFFYFRQLLNVVIGCRITSSKMCNGFKLSHYDVVGLDFDNTLLQYNLGNIFQLSYNYLTKYLVEKKGYQGLPTTMDKNDIDFIRKGLFLDFNRGNILKVAADGTIIKASHGTKKLSIDEVIDVYGEERRWPPVDQFIEDKLISTVSEHTYNFLDFTDCVAIRIYARVIDLVDENRSSEYKAVWNHLLEAIVDMYTLGSDYILTVGKNLPQYVYKCDSQVIEWLQKLKEKSKLILITSAEPETVNYLAKYCLGSNWESLFHTIIDSAKKPTFFSGKNSFKDINNKEIELNTSRGYYRNGNWQDLNRILTEELGRPVRCVYMGDNIIQDIYAPSATSNPPLDTVSIMEESLAEGYFPGVHPHAEYIKSNFWGGYFEQDGTPTLMGDIILKHSKLCIPLIKYLAEKPLDYQHVLFWPGFNINEDKIKLQQLN